MNGSRLGNIEADGDIYVRGSRIGNIESDGDIYLRGSRWGNAQHCCATAKDRQRVAAVVLFFAGDYR